MKDIPVGLLVKAIEENYANYGKEKDDINKKTQYIGELRTILNPIIDKTGNKFLRNILQDYQIYKERKDKEQTERSQITLKETFTRVDFLKEELLKLGYSNEVDIMHEIGIKSDEDFKRILFVTMGELEIVRQEVVV